MILRTVGLKFKVSVYKIKGEKWVKEESLDDKLRYTSIF